MGTCVGETVGVCVAGGCVGVADGVVVSRGIGVSAVDIVGLGALAVGLGIVAVCGDIVSVADVDKEI